MKNITLDKFTKELYSFESFTLEDLKTLYEKYSEKKVKEMFDLITSSLDEKSFIEFAKKYSVYFDIQNKDYDNELEKTDSVRFILSNLSSSKIMTYEEEKYYGNIIKLSQDNLTIASYDDFTLYPKLDVKLILNSICMANDFQKGINLLEKIKHLPYALGDDNLFLNENKIFKLFLKQSNDKEKINVFKNENEPYLDEKKLFYELELLEKCVISKYNFFNRNLKLVVSIAKKFCGKNTSFEDFIQDGNLGLIKAINRFEVDKGFRFSTYATWWIKACISRHMAMFDETIRKPASLVFLYNKYDRFIQEYKSLNGCEPDINVVANYMNLSIEQINHIITSFSKISSLEYSLNPDEDDYTLKSILKDDSLTPSQIYEEKDLNNLILKSFEDLLDERSIEILKKRYGFTENGERYTLEDVGKMYGITRERTRQIEKKALRKLKTNDYLYGFKSYLD